MLLISPLVPPGRNELLRGYLGNDGVVLALERFHGIILCVELCALRQYAIFGRTCLSKSRKTDSGDMDCTPPVRQANLVTGVCGFCGSVLRKRFGFERHGDM